MRDTKKELEAQIKWHDAHRSAAKAVKFVLRESSPEEMCRLTEKVLANRALSASERNLIAASVIITIVAVAPQSAAERDTHLQ